ncbi:unnamed protein product [Rotaria sp. Silwood1]|nr:unnamed protein product [Rotaria sp. Silwood1]
MTDQVREFQLQSYCFYYDATNSIVKSESVMKPILEIIEYCLRPENMTSIEQFPSSSNATIWKFEELHEKQITSEQLYLWPAPIDIVEHYEHYLNNPSTQTSKQVFYNCTHGFFGQYCQYSFEWFISFHQIVRNVFELKEYGINEEITIPCFMLSPTCDFNHSIICLDWRQICDGKLDCTNAVDEYGCFNLEFNVCNDNEFQCQNGQCIPLELYHDDPFNPDCLDGTDEINKVEQNFELCHVNSTMQCEGRGLSVGFVCSDGYTDAPSIITLLGHIGICRNSRISKAIAEVLFYNENTFLPFKCREGMNAFLFSSPME